MDFTTDLGSPNSMFNPVYADDYIYVNQINTGYQGFGRYHTGWDTPLMVVDNRGIVEHRMVMPFRGAFKNTYLIASSSGAAPTTTTFTRYNFDGTEPVSVPSPGGQVVEGFDWADDNTVIHTSYGSGTRNRLYLAKVTAEPFALEADTRWNAQGYVTTSVTTRIRNVRTGDVYSNYAYYGDAGQNNNPNFYAINLTTGAETLLGNAGTLTGGGSFGVWTVVERGGYLYVQTTDDGVQVYNMTSATQLGALVATYTKAEIDAVTGQGFQYWGFDVVPDGSRFIISSVAKVYEIGAPQLKISVDPSYASLYWPASVTAVAVQSASTLAPGAFADMDPQPFYYQDGKTNVAQMSLGAENTFFRLRRNP
jgi:hypothetical protein